MDEITQYYPFILVVALAIIGFQTFRANALISRQQKLIDRQNDTIQRLINREPVTYAEVGTTSQETDRTVYAAWGAQMVNLDEDERQ